MFRKNHIQVDGTLFQTDIKFSGLKEKQKLKNTYYCGGCGTASLFAQIPSLVEGKPVEFLLKDVEKAGDGGLRLNYQPKNRKG